MNNDKSTPILKKDLENEQDIENQDYLGEPNAKADTTEKPTKNNPENIPESNDPVGYANQGNEKESPSGQRNS